MQKKKVLLKHRLEYILFKAYIFKIKILPRFFFNIDRLFILFLFKILSQRHSNIVEKNIKIVFPSYDKSQITNFKKKVYYHFSGIFLEIIYLFVKKDTEKIINRVKISGLEKISEVLLKNKGLIIFSAHFGNWELIPFLLNKNLNKTIFSIARKMDNPLVEEKIVAKFRKFMGSKIIYKDKSIRTILKLLDDNEIIFLLIDQNTILREGAIVNFFNKKVSAVTSVAQIHLKRNIPVLPAFVHYENNEIFFNIQDEITFDRSNDHKRDVQDLTQRYTDIIETNIRKNPIQWFWFHNRWKDDYGEK